MRQLKKGAEDCFSPQSNIETIQSVVIMRMVTVKLVKLSFTYIASSLSNIQGDYKKIGSLELLGCVGST